VHIEVITLVSYIKFISFFSFMNISFKVVLFDVFYSL